MNKKVFMRIVNDLSCDEYFTLRYNVVKQVGLSPIQKCTAAMRMLVYGMLGDACDEYVKIGSSTAIECLKRFCDGVVHLYEGFYLRKPNGEDLERLLRVAKDRGFPHMIGSIDYMHWEWKNCPVGWQGQFTGGHQGTAMVILESVASFDLWIWHAFFGFPGTLNDINVLDRSPVFDDVEQGKTPKVNFIVNRRHYDLTYYLADGIYPKWPIFIQSIRGPQGEREKLFVERQQAYRKDVEQTFGVLQSRFQIIRQPARLWDLSDLSTIMRACIILHNMIVEDERVNYAYNQGLAEYD
ncbi:hypothetical protein LIER_08325 [Lithospermum erythrorhizon]|uniref:Nuclease HARBI1 n=1 Tax=Lithospermum erythrorhizon TaxID=34254 RepID=A0AAV3PCB6_LITER